ncbi:hypothetical protein [Propionibacterium australiense]|uniref:hypothetical protein n=1 Tax=Propionibacterium australiense TaxID=119981 RepID=UPI000F83A90A|nr:hypothetical protein [Propionibacterium australiense]
MRVDEMYPGFEEWAASLRNLLISRAYIQNKMLFLGGSDWLFYTWCSARVVDAKGELLFDNSLSVDLLEGPGTPLGDLVGRTVVEVVPDFALDLGNLTLVLDDGVRIECTDDTDWEPWNFRVEEDYW